jgi:hypothetical protein
MVFSGFNRLRAGLHRIAVGELVGLLDQQPGLPAPRRILVSE